MPREHPPLSWPTSGRHGYAACMRPAVRLALILGLLVSPATAAERLVGRARVIDGDTIVVDGVHVRLQGVAVPEVAHPGQPQDELGGPEAQAFVQDPIEGRTVVCELTEAGLARDCPRYSHGRYATLEPEAARRLPLPNYCVPR
jgi:micrococcal nuclease